MSADLFKKSFSKSVDEERQRNMKIEKERRIRREEEQERIADIRDSVESVISQIPSVFQVSDVEFGSHGGFRVEIPRRDKSGLHVRIIWDDSEWHDHLSKEERYSVVIEPLDLDFSLKPDSGLYATPFDSGFMYREGVGKWLGSELGRILGGEYERHRGFYEKMEDGL